METKEKMDSGNYSNIYLFLKLKYGRIAPLSIVPHPNIVDTNSFFTAELLPRLRLLKKAARYLKLNSIHEIFLYELI